MEVTGAVSVDDNAVKDIVDRDISGAYYGWLSKANFFLYPKETIERDLKNAFLSVGALDLKLDNHQLVISLVERKPSYLWCDGNPTNNGDCYFVDDEGYVFSPAPTFSGNAFVILYGNVATTSPVGQFYDSPEDFKSLLKIIGNLKEKSIVVDSVNSKENEVTELGLDSGGRIIFKETQDFDDLISEIGLIKNQTSILEASSTKHLDYLDMRFGNKIFYKLAGDNAVQTAP